LPNDPTIRLALGLLGRLVPGAPAAVASFKTSALAGCILLIGMLAVLASAGMGCAALWTAVAPALGPAGASLTVAVALAVFALVALFVAWRIDRGGRKPVQSGIPPEQFDAMLKAFGDLVGEHKAGAMVAAMLAGAAAEQAARRQ
jgi:hypothetical protein